MATTKHETETPTAVVGEVGPELIVQRAPEPPTAEPGGGTTEFKLSAAWAGLLVSAGALVAATNAAGYTHIDQGVVLAVEGVVTAGTTVVVLGYTFARSIRKRGTQG